VDDIRITLIEDHDLTRVGMKTALQQRSGFQVIGEAANAADALKLLAQVHPDVAIVDIGLPDMDGIELTRQLKQSPVELLANTKVLILTLEDSEETVMAAFAAGADSYCMKDVSLDQLAEALRVTQEGHSWIDPAIARIVLRQAQQARPDSTSVKSVPVRLINAESNSDGNHDAPLLEASPLTERELEVLQLIVDGYSNAAISDQLYITVGTVKTHVRNILNKLCADDRTQAAVRALRSGLVG
jgi:two-component system, NarL family, response regulator LiaR